MKTLFNRFNIINFILILILSTFTFLHVANAIQINNKPELNKNNIITQTMGISQEASQLLFKGELSGIWIDPVPDGSSPVFQGVGTNFFKYGSGSSPNTLLFNGCDYNAKTNEPFVIGSISYFNGSVPLNSDASSVKLRITDSINSPIEYETNMDFTLKLENTPNTGSDWDNADYVYFPESFPESYFSVNDKNYKLELIGFSQDQGESIVKQFHVLEKHETSADLYAWMTEIDPNSEIVKIEIKGTQNILIDNQAKYECIAHYSNEKIRNVSEASLWTDLCEAGSVNSKGLFTATNNLDSNQIESCKIEAEYQNIKTSISINIVNLNSSCSLEDDDSDGVVNEWDKCDNTQEGLYTDKNGCPYNDNNAVSGRISMKGKPVTKGKAMLIQSGEIHQNSPLDSNGGFKFNSVDEEKSFSVIIRRTE